MRISVIMPALDEEKNIEAALDNTFAAFKDLGIDGEVVVVNDGSTDSTPSIIRRKSEQPSGKIGVIDHKIPQGIGSSFWDGVDKAGGEACVMLPGDNENDPKEILRYAHLLEDVDIVIPFVFNTGVRSFSRNLLSILYLFIINSTFKTSLNYTNGTVLYRKSLLTDLGVRQGGFFYQTDILIRLIKRGYLFAEVPYGLGKRKQGKSTALSLKSLGEVIKGYLGLVKDIYFGKEKKTKSRTKDSISAKRHEKS